MIVEQNRSATEIAGMNVYWLQWFSSFQFAAKLLSTIGPTLFKREL